MLKIFNLEEDCFNVFNCREEESFVLEEGKKVSEWGFKKVMEQKRRAEV